MMIHWTKLFSRTRMIFLVVFFITAFLDCHGFLSNIPSTLQPQRRLHTNPAIVVQCFDSRKSLRRMSSESPVISEQSTSIGSGTDNGTQSSSMEVRSYQHKDWNLSYRHKPASPGHESDPPLLLVHPIGPGLSSWFWENMMDVWPGAIYAPDLIGCGLLGDPFDPDVRGMSFPLEWVRGCETLLNNIHENRDNTREKSNNDGGGSFSWPWKSRLPSNTSNKSNKFVVVAQGGLAPVGVMLASRNFDRVSGLVLATPPKWEEMVTPIPSRELEKNYNFLTSKILGNLAFNLLESRWAIEFFSNLFLFQNKCSDRWLELACAGCGLEQRTPIQAFNAGLCNHRSFEEEMVDPRMPPTLILNGNESLNSAESIGPYQQNMAMCDLVTLPGKNVLPWENPKDCCDAIQAFCNN